MSIMEFDLGFRTKIVMDYLVTTLGNNDPWEYTGSLVLNTPTEYTSLEWTDTRPKPSWETLQANWGNAILWYYHTFFERPGNELENAGDAIKALGDNLNPKIAAKASSASVNASVNTLQSQIDTNQTYLQNALEGKATLAHNHNETDVIGLTTDLANLQSQVNTKASSTALGAAISLAQDNLTAGLATKAALAHTHVVGDVTGLQSALDSKLINQFTPSTSARTLNASFTPSSTKSIICIYTVEITATANLSGGQTGTVELRSDNNATPTTVRCQVSNGNSVSLAIALTAVNTQRGTLVYVVPAGHKVLLATSGTATITLINQTEVSLG